MQESVVIIKTAALILCLLGNTMCVLGDGSCVCMKTAALTQNGSVADAEDAPWRLCTELTGSDCDPVYRAVSDGRNLFTCCRDSLIRRYALNSLH